MQKYFLKQLIVETQSISTPFVLLAQVAIVSSQLAMYSAGFDHSQLATSWSKTSLEPVISKRIEWYGKQ